MTELSGRCLCGAIAFSGDADIKMMANCHCSDCRAATGAAYGTLVFVDPSEIAGSEVAHTVDGHKCGFCGVGSPPVTIKHHRALNQDFAWGVRW